MSIKLAVSPVAHECDTPEKPISPLESEAQLKQLSEAIAFQSQCKADAEEFLRFYFTPGGVIQTQEMAEFLEKKGVLDRWFLIHLIEAAGQRFLDQAFSDHKAEMARSKNAKERAWVREQWAGRTDKDQSKAAFGRQYAHLVKINFGTNVTPDTISRDWLTGQK